MTHKMYFQIASGIVALFFYSPAFAQQHAVGLYYPDFAAFQRMFGASGINTLASNEAVRRVIAAWDNISPEGRELLLQESDLALAVVDSDGRWLFRSSGVHALRSFNGVGVSNKQDLPNLERILEYAGFQQLREYFRSQLFSPGRKLNASIFGSPLHNLDQDLASNAEKDWFRAVIGAEILDLDSATRTTFIQDPIFGKELLAAISLAQVTREKQLNDVWQAAVLGESRHEIGIWEIQRYIPERGGAISGWDVSYSLGTVKGKRLLVWATAGRTFILSPGREDTNLSFDFTKAHITAALAGGTARFFVAAPGATTVSEVTMGVKR